MNTEVASLKNNASKQATHSSFTLSFFALLTVGLVSITWMVTKDRIAEQQRANEQKALFEVLPDRYFDNNLSKTVVILPDTSLLGPVGEDAKGWLAFKHDTPEAIILPVVAPDGYNGRIQLMVGINREGILTGVRTIVHKETPGLGDGIDTKVSSWITSFTGRSLFTPDTSQWAVKKDGGSFDQFTGATITPRAVVNATYRALLYFEQNQERIFSAASKQWQEQHTEKQEQ